MATKLAIADELINKAVRLGKHKTKTEAVTTALEQYIKARLRDGIKDLIEKVEFHEDFDHKAMRRRHRGT